MCTCGFWSFPRGVWGLYVSYYDRFFYTGAVLYLSVYKYAFIYRDRFLYSSHFRIAVRSVYTFSSQMILFHIYFIQFSPVLRSELKLYAALLCMASLTSCINVRNIWKQLETYKYNEENRICSKLKKYKKSIYSKNWMLL